MRPTVADFTQLLAAYMPPELSLQRTLYAFGTIMMSQALIRFNQNQRRQPHQRPETGWEQALKGLVEIAFNPPIRGPATDVEGEDVAYNGWDGEIPADHSILDRIVCDIERFVGMVDWPFDEIRSRLTVLPPVMLFTPRLSCEFCTQGALVKEDRLTIVSVLDEKINWNKGVYVVARCRQCMARYYVDHFTFREDIPGDSEADNGRRRRQKLEYAPEYLCISQKEMIFVHRNVAVLQEGAVFRYKSSWSAFADYLNRTLLKNKPVVNTDQMHKLFVENFTRRLLVAHGRTNNFTCSPNASAEQMTQHLLAFIGENGGMVPGALEHTCSGCTHEKREATAEYMGLNDEFNGVVGFDEIPAARRAIQEQELPAGGPDEPKHYVRMAVMDGKTLSHKICAIPQCRGPLVNYKNGRFCTEHAEFNKICAISNCQREVGEEGNSVTCNLREHRQLYHSFSNRFAHESFLGVRRAIARKTTPREFEPHDDEDISNNANQHRFRARRIYCVETIQWSCGTPIAWGKCYNAESVSQVFSLCEQWFPVGTCKPQFLVYDKACKLLAHLITQHEGSDWLRSTRFIVDAFHYINHRATDQLCRERCNPAPTNGTQPDLVHFIRDDSGRLHASRAFNTETAEQFNAWMDGFESQLRSMKDFNFDFFIHVIMLLYKEKMNESLMDTDEVQ